jgi:5-oxoprolinase (ATP-hydrolysing) subunit A
MTRTIDLNCDMGEGFGAWTMGHDDELLDIVSSANLACGFHAGDPSIMARLSREAQRRGVAVGAHPGYPDLWGFGRRPMQFSDEDLRNLLAYQIGAAIAVAKTQGARLSHVKTHGELGHLVVNEPRVGELLIDTVMAIDPELVFTVMATTGFEQQLQRRGCRLAREIYADRAYLDDGRLMPRRLEGSVIHDAAQAADRVAEMVDRQCIVTASGKRLSTPIDSVCVHGDSPEAVSMARAVRTRLEEMGYSIAPFAGQA